MMLTYSENDVDRLTEDLRQQLDAAQADAKTAWEKAGEACTAHAESIKREVMLRDSLKHIASGVKANGCLSTVDYCVDIADEAIAATDDLSGVRLCHVEPIGRVEIEDGYTHGYIFSDLILPNDLLLYHAWKPGK